jgi:hypothetical protein
MKCNLENINNKEIYKLVNKDKIWDSKSINYQILINNKKPNRKIKYNKYQLFRINDINLIIHLLLLKHLFFIFIIIYLLIIILSNNKRIIL